VARCTVGAMALDAPLDDGRILAVRRGDVPDRRDGALPSWRNAIDGFSAIRVCPGAAMLVSERLAARVRRSAALIVGSLVLALAWASPAAAVDPGAVKLDRKTGCPSFYFPTQPQNPPSPLLTPPHGEHCFQMAAPEVLPLQRFFPSPTPGGSGGCAGSLLVQEAIPKGVDDYVILPFSDIGLGTQILSPPGQQSIPIFNGADTYRAPPGSRVWGLGGGSNGGPCQAWDTHILGTAAYGVTFKWLLDGHITVHGSGTAAPNIRVDAGCSGSSGSGTTTTDSKGYYQFLVDRNTTCTVTPRLTKGLKSTPPDRVVHVRHADVHHVDFQLPCDATAGSTTDSASTDVRATSASGGGGCPLKVFVKVVGPIANAGTRSGLARDDALPNEGPVNFSTLTTSKTFNNFVEPNQEGQKCESGCANLLVTVIDPKTKQPVQGALVTTKLGSIDTQAEAKLQQGHQFLCVQSETPVIPQCGTTSPPMITDQKGQVHLIYWAPGEFEKAHTKVTADATCGTSGCIAACGCSLSDRKGSGNTKLEVVPYKVWQNNDGELSSKETGILMKIAESPTGLVELLNAATERYMLSKLTALAADELISEHLIDAIESPYGYAVSVGIQIKNSWDDYQEELAQDAAFLDGIGLSAVGLYDPPFEKTVPLAPAHDLTIQLLNVGGAAFGAPGLLYELGKELDRQAHDLHEHPVHGVKERIKVTAYEVSNCNVRNPICGPGYANAPGIQPELLFHFEFSNTLPGGDFHKTLLITFYDPLAWMLSQKIPKGLP